MICFVELRLRELSLQLRMQSFHILCLDSSHMAYLLSSGDTAISVINYV